MAQYTITIDTNSSSVKEKQKEKLNKVNGESTSSGNEKKEKTVSSVSTGLAIAYGTAITKQVASTAISTIGIRTDNIARQNRISNGMKMANEILGFAGTVGAGIKIGSVAGPAGAAVVGIMAAVGEITKKSIEAVNNNQTFNINQTGELINQQAAMERLGQLASDRNRGR